MLTADLCYGIFNFGGHICPFLEFHKTANLQTLDFLQKLQIPISQRIPMFWGFPYRFSKEKGQPLPGFRCKIYRKSIAKKKKVMSAVAQEMINITSNRNLYNVPCSYTPYNPFAYRHNCIVQQKPFAVVENLEKKLALQVGRSKKMSSNVEANNREWKASHYFRLLRSEYGCFLEILNSAGWPMNNLVKLIKQTNHNAENRSTKRYPHVVILECWSEAWKSNMIDLPLNYKKALIRFFYNPHCKYNLCANLYTLQKRHEKELCWIVLSSCHLTLPFFL